MGVTRFEDLIGWQRSRELNKLTYEFTQKGPLNKEFVQYLFISKGSCSELRSQLYAAKDVGYLDPEEFKTAFELAEETSKILQGLIKAIKKRDETGHKFK